MLPLVPTPDINQTLIHLSGDEQADPVAVLAELCDEYSPGEARTLFNGMQKITLTDECCNNNKIRDSQFVFGERVLKALEACYLICQNRELT